MGNRWVNFKKMLKDFWQSNMEKDYKKISAGLGVLLITFIWALVDIGIIAVSGGAIDWSAFFTKLIVGAGTFGSLITSSFFGKNKNNNHKSEVSDDKIK